MAPGRRRSFSSRASSSGPPRPASSRARPRSSPATRPGHRDLQRNGRPRARSVRFNLQPQLGGCAATPELALDTAGHLWIAWYSNATEPRACTCSSSTPRPALPSGRPRSRQQREQQQQQLRGEPRLRGHLSRRVRQLPGGRARQHDRLVVARPGRAHDHRQSRRRPDRVPGASSPPRTARTGASGSPGTTARPIARRSETPRVRAARCRTPACRRARRAAPTP